MFRHSEGPRSAATRPGLAESCSRLLSAIVLTLALAAMSCGTHGHRVTNQSPHVEIVGSPVEGDSVNYVVDFFWNGWDDDGAVVRSEYTVDIPASFTSEQIADPATPGIEWTSTTGTRVRIRFRVASGDSAAADSITYTSDRASAPHTFFVRTFDNEDAHSAVADRSFNAWTVLPRTSIQPPLPPLWSGPPHWTVFGSLTVRWSAVDPDGPPPDYRPAWTEYKLICVDSFLALHYADEVVNGESGRSTPWNRAMGDSATVTLTLTPGLYVLALRSIDEAGGTESRFEFSRNVLTVRSGDCPTIGRPVLTVREKVLGRNTFPVDGSIVDYQLLAGQCLDFDMSADARAYGGIIQGYRWCVDAVDDPPGEGTPAGCTPWGFIPGTGPICFPTPGVYTVSFAARSTSAPCGGSVTVGTFRLTVLPRDFGRDVLYIDDLFNPTTDAETDRRCLTALRNAGFESVDSYDAWGPRDLDGAVSSPSLLLLARYRLLFWLVGGAGGGTQNANSALLQASACATNRVLREYVAAGGAVWINGEMVFGALKDRSGNRGNCIATTSYDASTGLIFGDGDFVTDYLHIAGGDIRDAKTGTTSNGLLRARPTARALAEGFPTLEADSTTYAYAALGGLPFYDAMFQPTFQMEGGLDTLYTAEPVRANSVFLNKPIAWRYADPSPTPAQGAVAITSFPLQKMKEGAASHEVNGVPVSGTGMYGLVEAMAKWFRAHDATQAAARPWAGGASGLHPRYDARTGRN